MRLLKATAPNWFAPVINLPKSLSAVVVLDDDSSIHSVWAERFTALKRQLNHYDFFHGVDFTRWIAEHSIENTLFLMDYELLGESQSGLDVLESLNLQDHCYLVTSRYDNLRIRERCRARGIKIIPKYYAAHIPLKERGKHKIMLIDNEQMVRWTWADIARGLGERFFAFADAQAFFAVLDDYPKDTVIYIDAELDKGERGEQVAKVLYDKGYHNLYLATGHPPHHFSALTRLKGVVGKTPPF